MAKKTVSSKQKKEEKLACALLKATRGSPLKIRRIARGLTGLPARDASTKLLFCKLKGSKEIRELIKSAIANAENNHDMDIDNLFIYTIEVNKALVMKRIRARAKGRADRILKPFSSIKVVLVEKQQEVK